ncbi:hypothetical protein [Lentzea aerocolonigenes]|uniref:hypothetical protein n=1 Tax=Lentzea aerocolonigenes TaxID=68170 RepID=UPI0012E0FCED|nr:hypothetical protein [Lentzea aerocolonigenes]
MIALAKHHRCTLVALCSRRSSAEAAASLAEREGVEIVAVDIAAATPGLIPEFRTTAMLRGGVFDRRTDTSVKRNLGLLMAAVAGWERVVYVDDDVVVPRPDDLGDAAGLLGEYSRVGLPVGGFPDNSVVCHAHRDAGGAQDTFIGTGTLAVGEASFTSFFPDTYNEDWLFLLNDTGLSPSAVTGLAIQQPYDPYLDTTRARTEEFGDCIAEGLFSLLGAGRRLTDADAGYWHRYLARRRLFINEVMGMAERAQLDSVTKDRMRACLTAALECNLLIGPGLCLDFMSAWRADRQTWRRHVELTRRHHGGQPVQKLLADAGLVHRYLSGA